MAAENGYRIETGLRVNGRAALTSDPAICQRLTARGQAALLAIPVEECFFHCAKAFPRANLWKPDTWTPYHISFGTMLAPKLGGDEQLADAIDAMVDENYRTDL